jgi:hypothetical protein
VLVAVVVDWSGSTAYSVSTRPNRGFARPVAWCARCCTTCMTSTNALPEPDRGSAVPQHRPGCLQLLIAAIGSWTTGYSADVIAALRADGEDVADHLETHLSPVAWESMNFLGQFASDRTTAHPHGNRPPLRSGSDDVDKCA